MGMITVRGIDDSVLRALHDRATAAGRSVEEEVREILAQTVTPPHQDFWECADRLRASFGNQVVSDSGAIASEMRAERFSQIGERKITSTRLTQ